MVNLALRILRWVLELLPAQKGEVPPVTSMYSSTPRLHMSVAGVQ